MNHTLEELPASIARLAELGAAAGLDDADGGHHPGAGGVEETSTATPPRG